MYSLVNGILYKIDTIKLLKLYKIDTFSKVIQLISCKKLNDLMIVQNVNKYALRKQGINANTLDKLLSTEVFDNRTLDKLCKALNCQPSDILEYIPDDE